MKIKAVLLVILFIFAGLFLAYAGTPDAPGPTKSGNVADTFSNIGALYMGTTATTAVDIVLNGAKPQSTLISVSTNSALICWGESAPTATCHTLSPGTFMSMTGPAWAKRGWIKNATAGQTAVWTITPAF